MKEEMCSHIRRFMHHGIKVYYQVTMEKYQVNKGNW